MASIFDQLLNNIPLFTAIIIFIMLIAVGVVLYFMVFKEKIKAKIEENKAKKAERARQITEAKELAQEVLKSKDQELDYDDDRAERIIKGTFRKFMPNDNGKRKKKTAKVTDTEVDFDFNLIKGKLNEQPKEEDLNTDNTDTETDFDFEALKTPKK